MTAGPQPRPCSRTGVGGIELWLLRSLSGKRGGFFLVDIDAPEELYKLFGPEFYDTCRMDAQPVTPIETAGEIFGQWAEEGR